MAEAHSAVAFSFAVTSEGFTYDLNTEVLRALAKSTIESWKHSASRLKNSVYSKFYPFHVTSWFIFAVAVFLASFFDVHASRYPVAVIENFLKLHCGLTLSYHMFGCLIFAFLLWSLGSMVNRLLLRVLLSNTGWIYKMPNNIDASVKIWAYLLKLLQGRKPRLYSYQNSLPSLPLPSLRDTLERYLASVRCLHSEADFAELCRKAREFRKGSGRKLQFFLNVKYWLTSNYVSDWWEEYVYLSSRAPLMSNSNYYGLETMWGPPGCPTQAARAAFLVYHCLKIRHAIYLGEMEPIMLHGIVPLCSLQYERQFNTTRIPETGKDVLVHWAKSDHIAVYHRGRYFKCPFVVEGRYLLPTELEAMFESILGDVSEPAAGEKRLAALTAGPRDDWAMARRSFFSSGVNRTSLNAIEKSAFFVVLDEEAFGNDYKNINAFAKSALCGKCCDRWFDKSFTMIVYKDAKFAANSEHSWADAPITSHAVESCLVHEFHYNAIREPYLQ
ncbi:Belongs to the carnitine choline acetyltransferase [Sparganum proliferum]